MPTVLQSTPALNGFPQCYHLPREQLQFPSSHKLAYGNRSKWTNAIDGMSQASLPMYQRHPCTVIILSDFLDPDGYEQGFKFAH